MVKYIVDIVESLKDFRFKAKNTITIANAASDSDTLNCKNKCLVGILMPAALTSATFTIKGSFDNVTFYEIENNYGSGLSDITFVADQLLSIDPALTLPYQYIQIETAGAEGAERTFQAITRFIS